MAIGIINIGSGFGTIAGTEFKSQNSGVGREREIGSILRTPSEYARTVRIEIVDREGFRFTRSNDEREVTIFPVHFREL
jgi:hypothetical protein